MIDSRTEVLTEAGWKKVTDLSKDDKVATVNLKTNNVEFVKVDKVVAKNVADKKVEMLGQNCAGIFTGDHVCLTLEGSKVIKKYALNLKVGMNIPISWVWDKEDIDIDDNVLRLLVQIAADGTVENTDLIRFHLKKDRKIKRLTGLLKELKIDYTLNKQKDGTVKINFNMPDSLVGYRVKNFDDKLLQTSKRQADLIVEEYLQTDGNMTSKNSFQITTSRKDEADVMQTLFILHGYSCNVLARKKNNNQEYVISAGNKRACRVTKVKTRSIKGEFYSVKNVNGTLFVRKDGKVHVTGD